MLASHRGIAKRKSTAVAQNSDDSDSELKPQRNYNLLWICGSLKTTGSQDTSLYYLALRLHLLNSELHVLTSAPADAKLSVTDKALAKRSEDTFRRTRENDLLYVSKNRLNLKNDDIK